MDELNRTVNVIVDNTAQMVDISRETTEKMQGYIALMEKTTDDMQVIEQSAHQTEMSITSLEDGMKEVTGEVEESFHQVNHVSGNLLKISQTE